MIRPILKFGEAPLHARAADVGELTGDIQKLIDDMIETMYAAPGIGLAAPQIGVPLRIFVVDLSLGRKADDLMVFVNPEFVELDGMQLEEEGCLSVPGFNATVARPMRAVVRGLDRNGTSAPSKARSCWPARFSTRWIISTASCFSIAFAASSAISS